MERSQLSLGRFHFLDTLRVKGWPTGGDLGNEPLYGPEGFCPDCRAPYGKQAGRLKLSSKALKPLPAVWTPQWYPSIILFDEPTARAVTGKFPSAEFYDVDMPKDYASVYQLIIPVTDEPWFDPDELTTAAVKVHGESGGRLCPVCGRYRWIQIYEDLPAAHFNPDKYDSPAIACHELFGVGGLAFRFNMFDIELAKLIVEASPKFFRLTRPL